MGPDAGTCDAELSRLCRLALESGFPSFRAARVEASFYPYIGLTHTIRRKGSAWALRISDHCRDAPALVLEAIALMLGSKVLRRRPPAQAVDLYRRFRRQPALQRRISERRLQRGRKQCTVSQGTTHSLEDVFRELNGRHFNNQVELSRLGWGVRRAWTRLGHYDPLHQTITISPVLDSPEVPRTVVRFIVYHEMLHAVFDASAAGGNRRHHPPEFRRAERACSDYAAAASFLRKFCRNRGRF